MARKRTKKPAKDVSLIQVPEMPDLYCIDNYGDGWEQGWQVLLGFHGPDYGIIIAGKDRRTGDNASEDDWHYVTRDEEDPHGDPFWTNQFTEIEMEDPHVYTDLATLSRDLMYLADWPITLDFRPMFWVRSEEGWRVPLRRLLARGIRVYTAAEVEEGRRRREEDAERRKHDDGGEGETGQEL